MSTYNEKRSVSSNAKPSSTGRQILTVEQIRAEQEKVRRDARSFGDRISDGMAEVLGSWPFIIGQTIFIAIWMTLNVLAVAYRWDPYPFILLNLIFSIQAAYSAPIIMMSQNRQADRDRVSAEGDYRVNQEAEARIITIQGMLDRLETALVTDKDSDASEGTAAIPRIQKQLDHIEALLVDAGRAGGE